MILSARQTRFLRWCSDKYDDPRAVRWLKDRLFDSTMHYCERRMPVVW